MTLKTSACRMNGMSRRIRKNSIDASLLVYVVERSVSGLGRNARRGLPDLADRNALQPLLPPVPEVDQAAREHHRGEHRRHDAEAVNDGEAAHRPRAERE